MIDWIISFQIKLMRLLRKTWIKKLFDNNTFFRNFMISAYGIFHIRKRIEKYYSVESYSSYINSIYPKKLLELKSLHDNQSCFIIGNGPSLTYEDLTSIKDYHTFGSNKIFHMNGYMPKYYFAQDFILLKDKDFYFNFKNYSDKSQKVFLPYNLLSKRSKNKLDSKIYYFYLKVPNKFTRNFSTEVDKFIEDGWTITFTILQIAIYMGFSKIYLLGVDNTIGSHFYESSEKSNPNFITQKSFEYLNELKPKNVQIINCTKGGLLDVFERKSLREVLNNLKQNVDQS
jgi:hypothetical protein